MGSRVFHKKIGSFTLNNLLKGIESVEYIVGSDNIVISNITTLKQASSSDIAFFTNSKYLQDLKKTKAGACILKREHRQYTPEGLVLVITNNPQLIYSRLIDKFYPKKVSKPEISSLSSIDSTAIIGKNCCIYNGVVIGANAIIGKNVFIGHNTIIGDNVVIGDNTHVESCVTIIFSYIGKNCLIYSGARIGQDGFGFIPGGPKIRQVGLVKIGNNVEIGANSCIDRGTLENTVIQDNCKIDNLIQIGHNVIIGKNTIIAAQTGVAGSTKIGESCLIGGQVGIAGHLNVGDRVMIAGKSGVINNVKNGEVVGGYPAIKMNNWYRQNIFLKKQLIK